MYDDIEVVIQKIGSVSICGQVENDDCENSNEIELLENNHETLSDKSLDKALFRTSLRLMENRIGKENNQLERKKIGSLSRGFDKLFGLLGDSSSTTYTYNNSGSIKNGTGIYEYINGDIYKGQLMNGKCNGRGILLYKNGDVYDGEFIDGQRAGFGVHTYVSGAKYIGSFENNLKHGYGTMTYVSGNSYEGEFRIGKRHGKGIYKYTDGSVYRGEFEDGVGISGEYTAPELITPQTECFSI